MNVSSSSACELHYGDRPPHVFMVGRVALLFRGQTFRWGLDAEGIALQKEAVSSAIRHVSKPLERSGLSVQHVLAMDIRPDVAACLTQDEAWRLLLKWHSRRAGLVVNVTAPTADRKLPPQARGFKRSLNLFMRRAHAFDALIVLRHDLRIQQPMDAWRCAAGPSTWPWRSISFPGRCPRFWSTYNCTNDVFHVVPRQHLGSFVQTIGLVRDPRATRRPVWPPGCCFGVECKGGGSDGHDCFNAAADLVPSTQLDVCTGPRRSSKNIRDFGVYLLPSCEDFPPAEHSWRCKPPFTFGNGFYNGRPERGDCSSLEHTTIDMRTGPS